MGYFIPALYEFIKDPDDADLREGSLQLLRNFARTEQGKQMISENIERVLEERRQILVFDEDYDDNQENELINSIHVTLAAEHESDAPATSAAHEDSAPASSALMLEPPQLNAASRAP